MGVAVSTAVRRGGVWDVDFAKESARAGPGVLEASDSRATPSIFRNEYNW